MRDGLEFCDRGRVGLGRERDDPVTVKTGHSTSELVLGPTPIDYAGVERPEVQRLAAHKCVQWVRHCAPGEMIVDGTGLSR